MTDNPVPLEQPYNPLDKKNLGVSVVDAVLAKSVSPLPPEQPFTGAGIYAIYYRGVFPAYQPITVKNKDGGVTAPIYVGKAVPAGARKGGLGLDIPPGQVLYSRLCEHAKSIEQATNLDLKDFFCRYLVVDDIWIPLGESLLIETLSPVWNRIVDGFGNHDPGSGRHKQQNSPWDVIHPGRPWAGRLQSNARTQEQILEALAKYFERFQADEAVTPLIKPPGVQ